MKSTFINKNYEVITYIIPILVVCFFIFFPDLGFAGTGGDELQEVYEATESMVSGYFSKIVAVISFAGALLAGFKGNYGAGLSALGVSVVAGVGPTMLTSGISALI